MSAARAVGALRSLGPVPPLLPTARACLPSGSMSSALHSCARSLQSTAPITRGVKPGSAVSTSSQLSDRVFDFKPVLAPHQVVYQHAAGPVPGSTSKWTPMSKRTGLLLLKCGMTCDYDQWGARRPLTVLKLESPVVVAQIREEERGYTALQVGAGVAKHVNRPMEFYLRKQGVETAPIKMTEFRVTPDALLPVGTALHVRHFVPGQYVNVTGTSQGKGFQGGMKRHGFRGQSASHGNSVSHRVLGSTGCRQTPGRVFKGKKMPGQMGGDTVTVECLRVYKLDISRGLLYVSGAVPGKAGGYLRVVDAPKKPWSETFQPPFPTYAPTETDRAVETQWAAARLSGAVFATPQNAGLGLPAYELLSPPPAVDPFAVPENDEAEEV